MRQPDQRARHVFSEAIKLNSPEERTAYLDHMCAGDESLRREVQSLLAAHERAGDFLGQTLQIPVPDSAVDRVGNEFMTKRGRRDSASGLLADGKRRLGFAHRDDIQTSFEFQLADESSGEDPPTQINSQ